MTILLLPVREVFPYEFDNLFIQHYIGISLMHDEGTGGNTNGGYGIFPLFPLTNCNFTSCPVALNARKTLRASGADGQSLLSWV